MWLLGLSQIIGYGTLYYSFAILADSAAATFEVPLSWLFGCLSVALLVGGFIAPWAGKLIDRHGAGVVMTVGSFIAAMSLAVAALAPSLPVFALATIAMQVAGTLALYDAAFAGLVQVTGAEARMRITHLTLIAGFASTIFWPLTSWLHDTLDWRQVYLLFAAANLLVCVPVHWLLTRDHRKRVVGPVETAAPEHAAVPERLRRPVLWLVTIGFALAGFALSAMLAQMVPLLTQVGLGSSALLVAMLFGPSQVLVRFVNLLLGAGRHPRGATLIALGLVPGAILVLGITSPWTGGAVLFAVLLGFGSGLKSIVQGTLPLALFGSSSYGARLGYMAAVRQILAAVAPFVLAVVIDFAGPVAALLFMATVGAAGLACMVFAIIASAP